MKPATYKFDRGALVERMRFCLNVVGGPKGAAPKIGYGVSTIYTYLGEKLPPLDFLLQLANASGQSPRWLILGEGWRRGPFFLLITAWLQR